MRFAHRVAAVVTAAALLILGTGSGASARWSDDEYVSLGDSYASGSGAADYDSAECMRSANSYPQLLVERNDWALSFVACGGAEIQDVWNNQLAALHDTADRVSISVGGNDAGWSDVVAACMLSGEEVCRETMDVAEDFIRGQLGPQLVELYGAIKSRAPEAEIVVLGYPRLFGDTTCTFAPGFTEVEQDWANQAADLLNRVTLQAAFAQGLRFVDVRPAFVGHAVCDPEPWLHGFSTDPGDAFHPNQAGYVGYADALDWVW